MPDDTEPLAPDAYPAITDYALLGDGHSAALVTSDGSIEWWCPERFDAPSVFARMLDRRRGGHLSLGIPGPHRREVGYVADTNVHECMLVSVDGRVRQTTFMLHEQSGHPENSRRIVRIVEGERGQVDLTLVFRPSFDYGRTRCRVWREEGSVRAAPSQETAGVGALRLASSVALAEPAPDELVQTVRVREADRHVFVLDWHPADESPPPVRDVVAWADEARGREERFWRDWISRCRYDGPYGAAVRRSLLALKLLQHVPTGALVAAPTLGLPERPGGPDNWDYRYAWLRDGAFIVMAFDTMGYKEEVHAFRRWLAQVVKRDAPGRIQMLYRVDGGKDLRERPLDHLEGYRRARPVWLGNKASEQHQLDTYGEVLMCFHRAPRIFEEEGEALWAPLRKIVERVVDDWRMEDSGIWERRKEHLNYVYSKAMAWVAIDHGLQIAQKQGFDAPVEAWRRARDDIKDWLVRDGYDHEDGGFMQAAERDVADASNLLFPQFGVFDFDDPRIQATLARTEKELVSHGFVHRHLMEHRSGAEGAFLACNFWLAHDLAHLGRLEEATRYMEAALSIASPLGLLPEEADAVTREPLGNHPQALSHLSLVLAAYALGQVGDASQAFRDGPAERHAA